MSPSDIERSVDALQAVLLDGSGRLAAAAGMPGQGLIGMVDNITAGFDALFTGLAGGTDNAALVESFTILRTFAVDAWAMLAHNLTRINGIITGTTAHVGELMTTALTGSLRNVLIAAVTAVNAPLSPASYAGLLTAGIQTGQLVVGNGLGVVRAVGDAGFDIGGIVTDELTFQLDNALGNLGTLLTQLGDASGSGVAKVVVAAVRGLAIAPALAVINFGSQVIKTTVSTAKAGFDAVVGVGSSIVGAPVTATGGAPVTPSAASTRGVEKIVPTGKAGSKKTRPGKATAGQGTTRAPAAGHSPRGARSAATGASR
ncbi:hypothetical protein ACTXG7_28955 [Mycolicibacterium sp. Dal123E01]|uniref:hypothetical protein n=1 Tax=Mycolicibacterium sp. Dal123E01 TaxID=3457578 RepID=UPI00403E5872